MDLSIVIVNWNGSAVLKNCLKSIFGMTHALDFEVLIVDNASTDDSVAMVEAEFPQVKLLRNSCNLGFAAGNNRGFAVAQGRYFLLLNSDTLLLPGALDKPVEYLDANLEAGALGCRIVYPDHSFQTSCYRFTSPTVLFLTRLLPLASIAGERLNFGRYWGREFAEPTHVDCVAGCFLMVRREIVEGVGELDEDFFMYGEDEEWCDRIRRSGWRIVYYPQAAIIHIHRYSSQKARRALRVIECMSPLLVLHKCRGHAAAWLGNLVMLGAILLRLPVWIILDIAQKSDESAYSGILKSRIDVFGMHLKGIIFPVWLPVRHMARKESIQSSCM